MEASVWRAAREQHHRRVDEALADHRDRSSRGEKHPVEDFLFEYYSFRPYQLRRWHPGHGVALAEGDEYLEIRDYVAVPGGVAVDVAAVLAHRASTVVWAARLLDAVARRPASFGCFGMHEWAMVHGLEVEQTRHPQLGLRLAPADIAQTVRDTGLRCTHIDAFRFFTPEAKPLNAHEPTRRTQADWDNAGCLHVGMDLYKVAYKLSPLVPSDLVWRCFELAREIRRLDMAASPYDVSGLGIPAVPVESPAGRAEYVRQQRAFAERGAPLRAELLAVVEPLVERVGA